MDVSVVVPTYLRPDLLKRCLDALVDQDYEPAQFEIIVVDDAVSEETRSLVLGFATRSRPNVRYVPVPHHGGPAAARNIGWRRAHSNVVAFTDDDCVPTRSWLREGMAALNASVVAVRGRIVMPLPKTPTDYELNAAGLETADFVTANCFCLKDALEKIGGFDERFTKAWREDSDLYFRLLKLGSIARADKAVVIHPVRPASWGVSLKQQRNNYFDALLFKKHPLLYRRKMNLRAPASYYLYTACLFASLATAPLGRPKLTAAFLASAALLAGKFFSFRLRGTSRRARHVWEMFVTSWAIPPLALYWRLRGALEYRVWFY